MKSKRRQARKRNLKEESSSDEETKEEPKYGKTKDGKYYAASSTLPLLIENAPVDKQKAFIAKTMLVQNHE